jgi:hypothetical protein
LVTTHPGQDLPRRPPQDRTPGIEVDIHPQHILVVTCWGQPVDVGATTMGGDAWRADAKARLSPVLDGVRDTIDDHARVVHVVRIDHRADVYRP